MSLPMALGRTAGLAKGGAAPVWTPLDDTGLQAWYDPSDPGARTLDGSDRFEALAPKGGSKEAAVQATEGARPTLTTLGGVEALGLDGDRWLRGAWAASLAQPCMTIVVCDITGTGATYVICDNTPGSTHAGGFFSSSLWRASANTNISSADGTRNGLRAHAFVANGADSSYYLDDFTTPGVTANAGANAIIGRTIGGNAGATPAGRIVGAIGDHIVTTSIDADTRALYAAWLTARYTGLTVTA